MNKKILEFKNISKSFGDFFANKDITFDIEEGEVHALLGENGAGKSTLMSVLFGLYNPTSGNIYMNGKRISINNPKDASKYKIAMLPQHFKLVENMSAYENIIIGYEDTKFLWLDKKHSIEKIKETQEKYNIKLDLNTKVFKLSTSEKQKIELLKILWRDNDVLIFDEPTSILTPSEIKTFLKLVKDLQKVGKTIIFITHKLEEVMEVSNRITVLRKGEYIKTVNTKTTNPKKLASLMVGKAVDLNLATIKKTKSSKNIVFKAEGISYTADSYGISLDGISLSVNESEIVGIAAIDGNGQSELFQIIGGIKKQDSGDIYIADHNISSLSVKERFINDDKSLLSHIPEDRHLHGLFLDSTAYMNSISQDISNYKLKFGMINKALVEEKYKTLEREFDIRGVHGATTIARSLSGGNQQKLIVAREVDRNPEFLIAVHPTRGVDVGSIRNIYEKIIAFRNKGGSVLFTSGELDEIVEVSDRVYVIYKGKIIGEFKGKLSKEKIGMAMLGVNETKKLTKGKATPSKKVGKNA